MEPQLRLRGRKTKTRLRRRNKSRLTSLRRKNRMRNKKSSQKMRQGGTTNKGVITKETGKTTARRSNRKLKRRNLQRYLVRSKRLRVDSMMRWDSISFPITKVTMTQMATYSTQTALMSSEGIMTIQVFTTQVKVISMSSQTTKRVIIPRTTMIKEKVVAKITRKVVVRKRMTSTMMML